MRDGAAVAFNMSDVDFIDSIGLVFLLRMREITETKGGSFAIYNLRPRVDRVLKRLNLSRILNIIESAEDYFSGMKERELSVV